MYRNIAFVACKMEVQEATIFIWLGQACVGLHELWFFANKNSCAQNSFSCISVHMGKRACKRADMHITNNNYDKAVEIVLN